MSQLALHCFRAALESVKMAGLVGHFQVTATAKIAVDFFVGHDLFHRRNRFQRSGKHAPRRFFAVARNQFGRAKLQAGQDHSAIARARAPSGRLRFEHGDVRAKFRQRARGGKAREARAENRNVNFFWKRPPLDARHFRRGEPEIFLLNRHALFLSENYLGSSLTARCASSMAASVYACAAESALAMAMRPNGARPSTFGRGPCGKSRSEYESYSYA